MEPTSVIPEEYLEALEALDRAGFSVTGLLGRGGTGVVFAAERAKGERVAVKLAWPWRAALAERNPEATVQRVRMPFLDEGTESRRYLCPTTQSVCNRAISGEFRRLQQVRDEAVVEAFADLSTGPRAGFVMERVPGPPLELRPGPGLVALAAALHRLHERGWAHGDLKPENVREAEQRSVRLIDPLAIGSDLITPEWSHLNFLVSTPLVPSADPRDRIAVYRHRDLVALSLVLCEAFAGERPWGHEKVSLMLDRFIPPGAKQEELASARRSLDRLVHRLPSPVRAFVRLTLEPGLWPDDGPAFAAYLQARPFETRCDALATLDVASIVAAACR